MRQMQIEGHSTKYVALLLKNVKIVKNKARLRNSQIEGSQHDITTKYKWYPGLDPRTEENH